MSNEEKEVYNKEWTTRVVIAREERTEAKTFRCAICGKVSRGMCLIYRIKVGGIVLLTFKACKDHFADLEGKEAGWQLLMEEDLEGFLQGEACEFLKENCRDNSFD